MHATMKFEGIIDEILEKAVKSGLAKTKAEALRLGVLELNSKYHLIRNTEALEDLEDLAEAKRISKLIKEGKMKLYTEEEFRKRRG